MLINIIYACVFIKINMLLGNNSVGVFLTVRLLWPLYIHLCNSFIHAFAKDTEASLLNHFWVPSTLPEA